MKSQWECVLENLGEWVGSFTTVTPTGELIEDISSIITLEGLDDNRSIHLVLKRFYPLPNSTEKYAKEVVWNFSTPPGVGAIYFDSGAFSSGVLAVNIGVKSIAEFSLVAGDRRFRMIQMFDPNQTLDRLTFVREQRQGTNPPERPQLTIADLVGKWQGTAITLSADHRSSSTVNIESALTVCDSGYQVVGDDHSIDLKVANGNLAANLLQFTDERDSQSYQMLLLPDAGYAITPTQIRPGHPFLLEIGWIHQHGKRQRLVRKYDGTGKWESVTFTSEEIYSSF
jgi:Domain of unknown function (DUF3598)